MNKRRRIFFIIFGVYHVIVLALISYIQLQKNDLNILLGLYSKISLMWFGSLLGVILFLIDFIWSWIETKSAEKNQGIMRHENNTLKAKIYDMQQTAKGEETLPQASSSKDKTM
ncbi:MAG: hypothetical protein MUF39_07250 [Cyclobacteriaceae bacterium]|nr:hypothetical protein [Cyclobacteriaceae bacterium]